MSRIKTLALVVVCSMAAVSCSGQHNPPSIEKPQSSQAAEPRASLERSEDLSVASSDADLSSEYNGLDDMIHLAQRFQTGHDEGFGTLYREYCEVCHGVKMEGTAQGSALVGEGRQDRIADLIEKISEGNPALGMPRWDGVLSETEIKNLAYYVAELQVNLGHQSYNFDKINIPEGEIKSNEHRFSIVDVASGLSPFVFSIAPMPDGSILLSERMNGLSIVSPNGDLMPVSGMPELIYKNDEPISASDQSLMLGMSMEVLLDPNYDENGWVYWSYGDYCRECNTVSKATGLPVSMVRVIRGKISNGLWEDQQNLWSVDESFYSSLPSANAAGRLSIDTQDNLYISIGMKSSRHLRAGIQDLSQPFGKIHRIKTDGTIPIDNPYLTTPGAMQSIWSIGHRTPQGLEFSPLLRQLWSTEMGPRGGDEINLIKPKNNYGWPLVSNGVNYDGTPLNYAEQFGIEFNPEDLSEPKVDLTPAPAISSFIIYDGDAFPAWRGDFIVGTLKGQSLLRFGLNETDFVEEEELLKELARIRDIEMDFDGSILLLIEHQSGAKIVRMVPSEN